MLGNQNGFKKGQIPWNKGTKGIMKAWNKGLIMPNGYSWNKGRHNVYSLETLKKMSIAKKGIPLSEEHKKNISIATKGKLRYDLRNKLPWNKGMTYSEELRKKCGKANIGKRLTKEHIKKCLKRRNMSNLEQKFNTIIVKNNLPYKFVGNGKFFIERKNPDFINCNGEKIAIEVYYRRHKQLFRNNIEQWKQERQDIFSKYGWKIKFFDETQVNENYVFNQLKGSD